MTLLELLIVLSLMAIIAAIAMPILAPGVSNTDLKTAARKVAAGLRMARNDAVATRTDTRVLLDLEHRTFQIERDPRVHALPREMQMKLFTAQSDLVTETTGAIRFYPDGGIQRRPRHARSGRAQVRSRRRLAYRPRRDSRLT